MFDAILAEYRTFLDFFSIAINCVLETGYGCVYPFADSVCLAAADEASLNNRMFGQEWGYDH